VKGRRISVEYTTLRPDSEDLRAIVTARSFNRYDHSRDQDRSQTDSKQNNSQEKVDGES
jgi:hypothetical protein